jgi:F-type H+-transporting ATPase subunit delta
MKGTRAALRYAKATLDLAKERGIAEKINDDMQLISKAISESKDLQIMLKSPVVRSSVKRSVLTKIFGSKVNPLTEKVMYLLLDNNRIELLELVAKEYVIIFDYLKGIETALVTTAVPLTKELEKEFLKKVTDLVGKEITVKNIVDPSIVGGYILRVGDQQLDSSVTGLLNSVLEDFGDNHYISKLN